MHKYCKSVIHLHINYLQLLILYSNGRDVSETEMNGQGRT